MKNEYFELQKRRDRYAGYINTGRADLVPPEERARAREEAEEIQRFATAMFTRHSGKPGPDCPF